MRYASDIFYRYEPATTPTTPTAPTTPAYPIQTSYKRLAKHALELSLEAYAALLSQAGIKNPLSPPYTPTGLYAKLYDTIKDYAVRTLTAASIPFGYETVRGDWFMVESPKVRSDAVNYMESALRLWGYHREAQVTATTPPLRIPPVEIDYTPTVTPGVTYPTTVEMDPPVPADVLEEGKVLNWSVSYTLAEAGHTSYPMQKYGQRLAVPQADFDRLVSRAKYIVEQMIEQNTYSPRL